MKHGKPQTGSLDSLPSCSPHSANHRAETEKTSPESGEDTADPFHTSRPIKVQMIAHPPFQPSMLALAESSTLSVKSGDFIQSWTWKYRIGETGKNHKAPTALTSDKYALQSLQTQETARVRNVLRKCHKNLMNPLISTILVQSQWGVHCQLLVSSQSAQKHWNGHNEQLPHIQSDSTTCIIHTQKRTVGAHSPCRFYSLKKSNCSLISRVESFDSAGLKRKLFKMI